MLHIFSTLLYTYIIHKYIPFYKNYILNKNNKNISVY